MYSSLYTRNKHIPSNKGKLIGQKPPLKLKQIWAIRDPLDDIKTARNISFVVKDDIVHDPQELLLSAEGGIGPKNPDDHEDWELKLRPLRD
jgi:hypothetical protein